MTIARLERACTALLGTAAEAESGLVLLKPAGGPQDAWDIDQLLDVDTSLMERVDARLGALPVECAGFWQRILAQRPPSN